MMHTQEPWRIGATKLIEGNNGVRTDINGSNWFGLASVVTRMANSNEDNPEGIANLERIIACVNAMAGIEDPAQFVWSAKELHKSVLLWEKMMMELVGEDGFDSVRKAIERLKAKGNVLQSERLSFTETDRDNLCDIVWWLRGYKKGADNTFNDCPFHQDHLDTLEKMTQIMREQLNKKL